MDKLLLRAAHRGKKHHHTLLTLLLKSGANANAADAQGQTALHKASHAGHRAIVVLLLSHGAIAWLAMYKTLQTPLHLAVAGRLLRGGELGELGEEMEGLMMALLMGGVQVDAGDARGRTVLHEAVWGGDVAMVRWLLARGARGDLGDKEGNTAVGMARCGGSRGVRELLVGAEEGEEGEKGQ